MKKISLIVLLLVSLPAVLKAQMYTGLNSKIILPAGDVNEFDSGISAELVAGYTLFQKVDVDISIGNSWYVSIHDGYQTSSLKANIKYCFLSQKTVSPYIGFGGGLFQKRYNLPFDQSRSENDIVITPSIGVLVDTDIFPGASVNVGVAYNKAYFDEPDPLEKINLKVGMRYHFSQN